MTTSSSSCWESAIGKNVSAKEFNTFLECDYNESTVYKFYWENKNVYIIEMANIEHSIAAAILFRYFDIPNNDETIFSPIKIVGISGQQYVAVFPCTPYVPRPNVPHSGPPPSYANAQLWTRQNSAPAVTNPNLPGVSVKMWEFGTLLYDTTIPTTCTRPGMPAYQVTIPVAITEWVPFDRFDKAEYLDAGGFRTVYKVKWCDGCIVSWDYKELDWLRKSEQ
ncbi:hypothetical protein Glove_94g18 [Diversispora epigaea]|uniref:Uncharacterized protein n=1 Tax=Diversispora epigaea TaxID=1348612 RepID=A0A397J7E9_9GLOM|nr:hypothetical protein Glove_94g18 [Diversispora epigaea]